MDSKSTNRFNNRAILGIFLLFFGILLLIDNLGWFSFHLIDFIFSLPFLSILFGIIIITRSRNPFFGFVLIAVGVLSLILQLLNIQYDHGRAFLSVFLIAIGLSILFRHRQHPHHYWKHQRKWQEYENWKQHEHWFEKTETSSDIIDEVNIFGGCERKITSRNFKGGKVTAIFGGSSLDMRDCVLADGINTLDIVNIFGGTKLLIPSHWKVHIEIASIFGGFADKRTNIIVDEAGNKELHLVGFVFFGGGEIKSF